MKTAVVILIILVIIGAGMGAYFLFLRQPAEPATNIVNTGGNTNAAAQSPVEATYSDYVGDDTNVAFKTVNQWIVVAPEEVEKALPDNLKQLYEIIHHASSPEGVSLTVSRRAYDKNSTTLDEMLEAETATSRELYPDYRIVLDEEQGGEVSIRYRGFFDVAGRPWIMSGTMLFVSTDEADFAYLMEVSVPENLTARYNAVVEVLRDSFMVQ